MVINAENFLLEAERVLDHPVKPKQEEVLKIGLDLGTTSIVLVVLGEANRPLAVVREFAQVVRDGLVVDFNRARMIVASLKKRMEEILGRELTQAAIAVPPGTGSRDVETHGYVASAAGLEVNSVMDEPAAANLVLGLANGAIVDIGGGTSEVAVISLGGIVTSKSVRVAGDEFDSAIINYIKKKYNLLIGERTAENLKIGIGSAFPYSDNEPVMDIKGRNLLNGLPENITVTSEEIREALNEPLNHVIEAVKVTLEKTPPELASDIIDSGIMLAGGGALLKGFDLLLHAETGMPVKIAERPLDCVADGTGKVLENIDKLIDVLNEDDSRY